MTAIAAAVRETAEEAGLRMRITGLVGLFSDPAYVIQVVTGEIRQPFAVCFHGVAEWGSPRPDKIEIADVGWFEPAQVEAVPLEPGARRWIHHAIAGTGEPHLDSNDQERQAGQVWRTALLNRPCSWAASTASRLLLTPSLV